MLSSPHSRLAFAIAHRATLAAAWVISKMRDIERLPLSDGDCERYGLPYGSTEEAVIVAWLVNAPWWWVDAWSDGGGCFHLRLLGHWGEVHYLPKGTAR